MNIYKKNAEPKNNLDFWFAEKTIEQVLNIIIGKQEKYLKTGNKRDLVPMIYREVALEVRKDVSTVARIVEKELFSINGKLISYKELFKEASLKTKDGRIVSQYEFFDQIRDIVNLENKRKPLSDDAIGEELERRGYLIKRRTVSKYRKEFLEIPKSNERRF